MLLLGSWGQQPPAAVPQLQHRAAGMALTVTHLYFVKSLAPNLLHVGLYGVRAIACQPVGASSKDEMRADIVRLAKQLINVATPVANMHAPRGLLELWWSNKNRQPDRLLKPKWHKP